MCMLSQFHSVYYIKRKTSTSIMPTTATTTLSQLSGVSKTLSSTTTKTAKETNNSTPSCSSSSTNSFISIPESREVASCGLANLGNTCYANAVLQSLAHSTEWCNAMELTPHRALCTRCISSHGDDDHDDGTKFCVLCEVENVISSIHSTTAIFSPIRFIDGFTTEIAPWFRKGLQEDSHEFLRLLTDGMQKSCLASSSSFEYPFQLFRGQVQSIVACFACHETSTTIDPMEDLGLECGMFSENNNKASIQHSLDKFIQEEALECYKCERCSTVGKATKRSKIKQIPPILTIHLKRFRYGSISTGTTTTNALTAASATTSNTNNVALSYNNSINNTSTSNNNNNAVTANNGNSGGNGNGSAAFASSFTNMGSTSSTAVGRTGSNKIEGHVKFDELFDLRPYLTEDWGYHNNNTSNINNTTRKTSSCFCRLFAVVVHTGSSSHSGHYYALVRNLKKNEWWKMDDGNAIQISAQEVTNAHAYMLFYRVVEHPVSIQLRDRVGERHKEQQQLQQLVSTTNSIAATSNEQQLMHPVIAVPDQDEHSVKNNTKVTTETTATTAITLEDTITAAVADTAESNEVATTITSVAEATTALSYISTTDVDDDNKNKNKRKSASSSSSSAISVEDWAAQALQLKKWRRSSNTRNKTMSLTSSYSKQNGRNTANNNNTATIVPLLKQAQTWISEKVELKPEYFQKLIEDSKKATAESFILCAGEDDVKQQDNDNHQHEYSCKVLKATIKRLLRKILTAKADNDKDHLKKDLQQQQKQKQRQLLMAQAVVIDDTPATSFLIFDEDENNSSDKNEHQATTPSGTDDTGDAAPVVVGTSSVD